MSRVAIVTGAARGIGAATVKRLTADGWVVVGVDRGTDDPRLPYALGSAEQLRGAAARTYAADASDESALTQIVGAVEREHGGLDAFVAAAGVIAGGVPLWEMPAAELVAVMEGCFVSAIASARAAIPALLRRPEPRSGRFVAVTSTAATRGLPMLAAYGAAKAGVAGLVRSLALELRGTGVTANSVSPGSTRTPMLDESARLYGLSSAEDFAAQQPIERLIEPGEVAALIAWVAGPQSAAVTGADLCVDGGLSV